ncbi:MAG: NAD(P)/FAD-dependent oxidoreductase [Actinomycetota bacterium]|nr:NAD(P)/FAD-dependent oxidoreductase [Actinomycetota bacterium]
MATLEAAIETPAASVEEFETIVIGGGQAGLAVGYYLKKRGRPFVILDANERIGGSWRTRTWRSLRLFTPARYDGLPGWSFPAPGWSYPTARETADYLEAYAERFDLPVRTGTAVDRLTKVGERYLVECGERRFEADRVVVATGFYGKPSVPDFAAELDPRIVQMHSSEYRDPSQLRPGGVLLVGAGNSGADIAMETSATHRTWLSGPDKGQVPLRIESPLARVVLPVLWFIASHVLTVRTPIGRKVRPHVLSEGAPRIRVKTDDLEGAGVESVPKTVGVQDGLPLLEDGRVLDVANVIWCTGFRQDFSWIDVPVFDEDLAPAHERGIASEPGLYFVGLDFLYAFTSENVGGVGRDARHIARHIASH